MSTSTAFALGVLTPLVVVAVAVVARSAPLWVRLACLWLHRVARRRMVRRLPWPDPPWRRLTTVRYRVGLALLRPYVDRLRFHWSEAYEADRSELALQRFLAVESIIRLDSEVGRGLVSRYLAAKRKVCEVPWWGGIYWGGAWTR